MVLKGDNIYYSHDFRKIKGGFAMFFWLLLIIIIFALWYYKRDLFENLLKENKKNENRKIQGWRHAL